MGRPVSFRQLQHRLVQVLRMGIRNGVFTERKLARITGVSQPHIHNILKGSRQFTPHTADRILEHLHLSVTDLIDEMAESSVPQAPGTTAVPLLATPLGPGLLLPSAGADSTFEQFPVSSLHQLKQPVLVRLMHDPVMRSLFQANDLAMVERDEEVRTRIVPGALYVIEWQGHGYVRWLHAPESDPRSPLADPLRQASFWFPRDSTRTDILSLIWGSVYWIGRNRWFWESALAAGGPANRMPSLMPGPPMDLDSGPQPERPPGATAASAG